MWLLGSVRRRLSRIEWLAYGVSWTDAVRLASKKAGQIDKLNPFLRLPQRRVTIRPGTSDLKCLEKVFVEREYDLPFPIKPKFIVDAGANIGLASVFFAHQYPDAKILAVEPEASNYELLRENVAGLPNVNPLQAAIWVSRTKLQITDPSAEKWNFSMKPKDGIGEGITAVTIPDILKQLGHEKIDLLKLDIEGAERELFQAGAEDWLSRVGVLIIETHDRYLPGCTKAVYSQLCRVPFDQEVRGENIFIRINPDHEA